MGKYYMLNKVNKQMPVIDNNANSHKKKETNINVVLSWFLTYKRIRY